MFKIIKVNEEFAYIGNSEGKVIKMNKSALDWEIKVGDYVELYESGDEIIVTKTDAQSEHLLNVEANNKIKKEETEKINIVINNQSNNQGTQYTQSGSEDTLRPVNKVCYVLLAIFLGTLGAHKFYAGKFGLGLLYILFFGIGAFLGFFEGIAAAFKPADNNGNILV